MAKSIKLCLVILGVVMLFCLSGCAKRPDPSGLRAGASGSTGSLGPSPSPDPNGIPDQVQPIDWNDPIFLGVRYRTASDAAAVLPFTPVVPSGVNALQGIFASDPTHVPPSAQTIGFVYKDQTMGTFVIEESLSQETEANLAAQLQYNSDPSNTEKLSIVTLSGGEMALLGVGTNTTYVQEIQGPLLVQVIGPSDSFSAEDAVAVANKVS